MLSTELLSNRYIDPTLTHDLTSNTRPWALSPLVSTMPHLAHARIPGSPPGRDSLKPDSDFTGPKVSQVALPPFPPSRSLVDDTSQLHLTVSNLDSPHGSSRSSASSSTTSISSTISANLSDSSTGSSSSKKSKDSSGRSSQKSEATPSRRKRQKSATPGLGLETASQRRSYFSSAQNRQAVQLGPEVRVYLC